MRLIYSKTDILGVLAKDAAKRAGELSHGIEDPSVIPDDIAVAFKVGEDACLSPEEVRARFNAIRAELEAAEEPQAHRTTDSEVAK